MLPLHPYLDHPGTAAIAHRGGTDHGPENSMASFSAAVALGYRYLETDVHLSKDGQLIAFHDDLLDRVTDRQGAISDLPWSEIKSARLSNGEAPPLFTDLLEAFPDTRINIDPKSDAAADALIAALPGWSAYDRLCVGSFSGARLNRLRVACGPALCTSMGPAQVLALRLASLALPIPAIRANCAQVPPRSHGLPVVDRLFVNAAHRWGLKVHVWTINDRDEMNRLIDIGVDGLMTDETKMLRDVLTERALWPEPSKQ